LAEVQGCFVEGKICQGSPQVELIAFAVAIEAVERVLANVDGEAGVGELISVVEGTRTSPLVAPDEKR
jgi:hypothetical protein